MNKPDLWVQLSEATLKVEHIIGWSKADNERDEIYVLMVIIDTQAQPLQIIYVDKELRDKDIENLDFAIHEYAKM